MLDVCKETLTETANDVDTTMKTNFHMVRLLLSIREFTYNIIGGPARKRRTAEGDEDDIFRYDRTNPILGTRQITSGFRKWAERYISECSGQKKYQHQVCLSLYNIKSSNYILQDQPNEQMERYSSRPPLGKPTTISNLKLLKIRLI